MKFIRVYVDGYLLRKQEVSIIAAAQLMAQQNDSEPSPVAMLDVLRHSQPGNIFPAEYDSSLIVVHS